MHDVFIDHLDQVGLWVGARPQALANFDTRGFIKLVAEAGSGPCSGYRPSRRKPAN